MLTNSGNRAAGMSMPELLVALAVFGFVVAGSIATAMMFAKLASNHENNSEFRRDVRIGFEALSYDVRNATNFVSRSATGFTLEYKDANNAIADVSYTYDSVTGTITRTDNTKSLELFNHVSDFDILFDENDTSSEPSLSYDPSKLSIKTLRFEASNSGGPDSQLSITNFTFKIRNSQ